MTSELAAFHASLRSTSEPAFATYLVKGTVAFKPAPEKRDERVNGDEMDVDQEFEGDDDEEITETRITLVGERELEGSFVSTLPICSSSTLPQMRNQPTYASNQNTYTVCLRQRWWYAVFVTLPGSPIHGLVQDAGVICGPCEEAHKADQAMSLEASITLGRITGNHVRVCVHS